MKWYDKSIPSIKEVLPYINNLSKDINSFQKNSSVYIWGSLYDNFNNKDYRIKDIDIAIECSYNSGDLLAIDNSFTGALKISKNELEDFGFNKQAVEFTKLLLSHKVSSIDFWAISKDKKILHWGPITDTIEEWKKVRKEAEKRAEITTGFKKNKAILSSNTDSNRWYEEYENYIQEYSNGCPQGWYCSSEKIDKILSKSIKII